MQYLCGDAVCSILVIFRAGIATCKEFAWNYPGGTGEGGRGCCHGSDSLVLNWLVGRHCSIGRVSDAVTVIKKI